MPAEYAQVRAVTSGADSRPGAEEDAALVARAARGDVSAFDALFRRYADYVYRVVHGILLDEDEAQDAAQDAFVRAYDGLPRFRQGSRFHTWLYRIAVNCALDRARRSARRRWLPFGTMSANRPDPSPGPPEQVERSVEDRAVRRALEAVAVRHREPLVLHYFQGLSVDEMAEAMGCSVPAAKVRLHRARMAFKERYVSANPEDTRDA